MVVVRWQYFYFVKMLNKFRIGSRKQVRSSYPNHNNFCLTYRHAYLTCIQIHLSQTNTPYTCIPYIETNISYTMYILHRDKYTLHTGMYTLDLNTYTLHIDTYIHVYLICSYSLHTDTHTLNIHIHLLTHTIIDKLTFHIDKKKQVYLTHRYPYTSISDRPPSVGIALIDTQVFVSISDSRLSVLLCVRVIDNRHFMCLCGRLSSVYTGFWQTVKVFILVYDILSRYLYIFLIACQGVHTGL